MNGWEQKLSTMLGYHRRHETDDFIYVQLKVGGYYECLHLRAEEIEAQRGEVTSLKSQRQEEVVGCEQSCLAPESLLAATMPPHLSRKFAVALTLAPPASRHGGWHIVGARPMSATLNLITLFKATAIALSF